MNGVLVAFGVSFGAIFVAEMGDKSQLMALTFATRLIEIAAGVLFIGFGIWTLRGDKLTDAERAKVELTGERNAVVTASVAFFLAELGDKTMLATITLATTYAPLGVWLGSTLGMLTADALAIFVGRVTRDPASGAGGTDRGGRAVLPVRHRSAGRRGPGLSSLTRGSRNGGPA